MPKFSGGRSGLVTTLGCGYLVFWLICAALSLALTVGAVYVALHFILKFW